MQCDKLLEGVFVLTLIAFRHCAASQQKLADLAAVSQSPESKYGFAVNRNFLAINW